ncbi:MAG TPA: hypothetical protein VGV91_14360 [Rubrobacter sp.]|nr:hypothetical protein [Rubrobacter sp.]
MVDQGRARDVNEAAARFAETLADSYRLVYGQAAESSERQQQRAREFSELVSANLSEQTEAGRANTQQLSEQARKQQEAYAEFLDTAFSNYRAGTEQATQRAQEGVRTLTDTTTGLLGTATGAVGTATGAASDAAGSAAGATVEAVVFPIGGYDEMNVDEVSERLEGLSVEELQLVRDYEETNKKRDTLLEKMDRKIRAA